MSVSTVKLNQLDIEELIKERKQITKEFIKFMKNWYTTLLNSMVVVKKIKVVRFILWDGWKDYVKKIYKHILADFREWNNCDKRFVIEKEDKEIVLTLETKKIKWEIILNFQNATFQEAEEIYQRVERRVVEIKKIIAIRSKVNKIIKKSQWSLVTTLSNFSSSKMKYPQTQTIYKIEDLFDTMLTKGEKRESKIMLSFLEDLLDDIQYDRIETRYLENLLTQISKENIDKVLNYYKFKLGQLLIYREENDTIDDELTKWKIINIIDIYKHISKYFDDKREEIQDIIVDIASKYVTIWWIGKIDQDIIKQLSLSVKWDAINTSNNIYNEIYKVFVNDDINFIDREHPIIDLMKYKFFSQEIWIKNSHKKFISNILIPLFIKKLSSILQNPFLEDTKGVSIEDINSVLNLEDCVFYNTMFTLLSEEEKKELNSYIYWEFIKTLTFLYKEKNYEKKKKALEYWLKFGKYWEYLDIEIKEAFVENILVETIWNQSVYDMEKYDMKSFEREDIVDNYEIYKFYMTDEFVDFYIDELMKVRKIEGA